MTYATTTHRPRASGVTLLLTLVFLCLFACMAVAITATTDAGLLGARNERDGRQASAIAQAGVQMMKQDIGGLAVPSTHDAADMHSAIATVLRTAFTGSTMVDPNSIYVSPTFGVILPTITVPRGDARTGTLNMVIRASGGALDNTTVTIQSTGRFGGAMRTATYNLTVQRGKTVFGDYGIASKSPIQINGNASVLGANNHAEANILSATYSPNAPAVQLVGNIHCGGDVSVCNPDGRISKTGNITIDGAQNIGAPEPQWPTVDITPFTPFATNPQTLGGSNVNLRNIRIPPGTNPIFSGNSTLSGVIYIQSPNRVTFTGNVIVTGVIVCDTPTVPNLANNYVKFTGNVQTYGVESLPAGDPQYSGLRSLTGSFLLAPGFDAEFTGNSTIVNGVMVASQFGFTGNSGGRIKGGVVCLADSSFRMTGNSPLVIDKNGMPDTPAGISSSCRLVCVSGSYSE
jgi:hypothetical protein